MSRVAVRDCKKENCNVISICIESTSADNEWKNDSMLRKSSIIAINGCVNKILNSRRIDVHKTIGVWDVLKEHKTFATDPFRLDSDGEDVW